MDAYTRIIGTTSNKRVPTLTEIGNGNETLTPYESAKNNGFMFEMSKQIGDISTELTNLLIAKGITPDDSDLTQVLQAIDQVGVLRPITITNNSVDPNNDMDFSAGNYTFSDFSGTIFTPAITKRLDAAWAAGNNNGGLFSGTKANSTTYHCFEIYDPINNLKDAGFSTSLIAADRPAAYTKYRKIASFRTNASANIRVGTYIHNRDGSYEFFFAQNTSILESVDAVFTTAEKTITLNIPTNTIPFLNIFLQGNGAAGGNSTINYYSSSADSLNVIVSRGAGTNIPNFLYPRLFISDGILRYTSSVNFTANQVGVYLTGWKDNNL